MHGGAYGNGMCLCGDGVHMCVSHMSSFCHLHASSCLALCRPFPLLQGVFGAADGVSMAGDVASYTCDHGYAYNDTQRAYKCLDTGMWNVTDIPQCRCKSTMLARHVDDKMTCARGALHV